MLAPHNEEQVQPCGVVVSGSATSVYSNSDAVSYFSAMTSLTCLLNGQSANGFVDIGKL